jgi:hypothetical protein
VDEGGAAHADAHGPLTEGDVVMGRHKKSHNQSHRRREQFEPARAARGGISPITWLLVLSAVLLVVMVYVIGARGQAA